VTDFAALLLRSLPGIYRQKDTDSQLARFLEIMASPLAETETSIGQLYEDLFGATARAEFLPMIGALIGAEIDAAQPTSLQRAALEDALPFFRSKGLGEPLARTVEAFTGWRTVTVDYSQVVARLPHVETTSPLVRQRDRLVAIDASGPDRFHVDTAGRPVTLFDEARGRPIARSEIASLAAELIGTERGFSIRDNGVDLVGLRAPAPRPVVGANLTDFADPRAPDGTPLVLTTGQIAVDPELGRLRFAAPVPSAGKLTVDFHQLVPASIAPQTFDLRDSQRMVQLGRSDDPAPYTIDLRSPAQPTDRIGRAHFDNHGLFLTVSKSFANRLPTELVRGARSGFSFDDAPLPEGNTAGRLIQLLDGIDGSPITVAKLSGHEADFADTPRGFTITARGVSLLDPAFGAGARVIAAKLADFANPTDVTNTALALGSRDIAVDPQRGRFLLTPASFGVTAAELRVGYLMAPVVRTTGATPALVGGPGSNTYAFAPDGRITALRNGVDGTLLSVKLHLGGEISDYHGTPRGYRIFVDGAELTSPGALIPHVGAIEGPTVVQAGRFLVDLDRGRFAVPPGTIAPGAAVTVEFSSADSDAEARMFERLAQRLPRLLPAGITPVVVDTRTSFVDPRNL